MIAFEAVRPRRLVDNPLVFVIECLAGLCLASPRRITNRRQNRTRIFPETAFYFVIQFSMAGSSSSDFSLHFAQQDLEGEMSHYLWHPENGFLD